MSTQLITPFTNKRLYPYDVEHYDGHESECVGEYVELDGEMVEGMEALTDVSVTTHDDVGI